MPVEFLPTDEKPRGWTDAECDAWWDMLSDHEKCIAAAQSAAIDGDVDDVVYAVEKPWHFKDEAYDLYWQAVQDLPH